MISQTSDDLITTAPESAEKPSGRASKVRKFNARTFDFLWKRDSQRENVLKKEDNQKKKEDVVEIKIVDSNAKNTLPNKTSLDFFKNIKKHMQVKNLTIRKSKRKTKGIEVFGPLPDSNSIVLPDEKTSSDISIYEKNVPESKCIDNLKNSDVIRSNETLNTTEASQSEYISESLIETIESYSGTEKKLKEINTQIIHNIETDNNHTSVSAINNFCSINETQELQLASINGNIAAQQEIENIETSTEANINNDNKVKANLAKELLKLSNYGWYWGPISGNEADAKLMSEPDGAFLVRDSSDDRYVLTLSFKSSGKLLHARMEHSGGLFSLCNQSESEGFSSVVDLIDYSVNFSQSAVFCYSRPKYPGHPSFPVRLTKPVSRFTQVRSLQYLCRFVIRQNTRLDNINKLPLPNTIKGYIEEAHY